MAVFKNMLIKYILSRLLIKEMADGLLISTRKSTNSIRQMFSKVITNEIIDDAEISGSNYPNNLKISICY